MILKGEVEKEILDYKDWLIGSFRDRVSHLHTSNFELKWSKRKKGYFAPAKESIDKRTTLGILVYGKARIKFIDKDTTIELAKEGDYYYCNPTERHEVEVLEDSLILTLRWQNS